MVNDDRVDFERQKAQSIADMGKDEAMFEASLDLIRKSDKHRYSYVWSWMGVPIIQRPADIVALQEVIFDTPSRTSSSKPASRVAAPSSIRRLCCR